MKKLFAVAALLLATTASATVQAQSWYLKKDSLACLTEEQFDEQIQMLTQDIFEFADGCGETRARYRVVMLDLNILSASKVRVVDNGLVVWVPHESLVSQ